MKLSTREMILAALFTSLTVVGAKMNLLLPAIPFTFQPIIVMLAGSLLTKKASLFSQIVYVAIGLTGIPVFAKPLAGPAYILTPSFGYLIGFAAGAYVIGYIIERSAKRSVWTFITANMTGLLIIYFFGVLYMYGLMNLYLANPMSLAKAIEVGMLIFILKDAAFGVGVSALSYMIHDRVKSQALNIY